MGGLVHISQRRNALKGYLSAVTFSSHLTIPSIMDIETRQMTRKIPQHFQMGIALYQIGPRKMKRLPIAVAASQRPWQRPSMLFGATLETKLKPSGEMKSSATVRKK